MSCPNLKRSWIEHCEQGSSASIVALQRNSMIAESKRLWPVRPHCLKQMAKRPDNLVSPFFFAHGVSHFEEAELLAILRLVIEEFSNCGRRRKCPPDDLSSVQRHFRSKDPLIKCCKRNGFIFKRKNTAQSKQLNPRSRLQPGVGVAVHNMPSSSSCTGGLPPQFFLPSPDNPRAFSVVVARVFRNCISDSASCCANSTRCSRTARRSSLFSFIFCRISSSVCRTAESWHSSFASIFLTQAFALSCSRRRCSCLSANSASFSFILSNLGAWYGLRKGLFTLL